MSPINLPSGVSGANDPPAPTAYDDTALADDTFTSVFEHLEYAISRAVSRSKFGHWLIVIAGLAILLLLVSPLFVFALSRPEAAKAWSGIVKNFAESVGILAAAAAAVKWVNERRDRATTVLLELEEKFQERTVKQGKELIDKNAFKGQDRPGRTEELDALLRFYVLLYGVYRARQVPPAALSYCFRYWLAHYFHSDYGWLRKYVGEYYPSTKAWLTRDWQEGGRFFRPHDFFKGDKLAEEFRQRR
jgi:hypothetical protein